MSDNKASVIQIENKQKNGKHKLTGPGPGRPKGSKDKLPRTVKENIEKAFEKLGGIEGLVKWAGKL